MSPELWRDLARDTAHAVRALQRQPVFAAATIGILALTIGGQTAMFSLVDAVLLRELPYRNPGALVSISHETEGAFSANLPYPLIEAFSRHARTLDAVAACYQNTGISRVTLSGLAEPESVKAGFAGARLFHVLGVPPALGRVFDAREEEAGERVAVLSDRLWRRAFDASPAALGASIEIDGVRSRVVGVMPARFQFPDRTVELWVPLTTNRSWRRDPAAQAGYLWLAVGRLAESSSPSAAEAELASILAATGSPSKVARVRVRPLEAGVAASSRLMLWTLFGAIGATLLVACSNLATLLLARGESRRRELAVRAAIGAGRGRLVRQLLAESLVLAVLAGALGALLAEALVRLVQQVAPGNLPRLEQAGVDLRSLLFLAACTGATALVFGLLPALRSTDSLHAGARDDGGAHPRATRLRRSLAAVQLALTLVLLSTAGLLLRSFLAAASVELGFEADRALVVRSRLPMDTGGARRAAYYAEVERRAAAVPGVEAVGAINDLFELQRVRSLTLRAIDGREAPPATALPLKWTAVSGDYFRAVGAPILEGRGFDERDGPEAPRVVVVDRGFAERFFPGERALGRRFKGQDARGRNDEWLTIVGIVGDTRREGLEQSPSPHVYELARQSGDATPDLIVRTRGRPAAFAGAVRGAVRAANAAAVIESVTTLRQSLGQQLERRRFEGALLSAFALGALALAALGLFGLVHYSASRRRREIGVRLALGATAGDVVLLFLRQLGAALVAGGLAGLAGAAVVAHALRAMLFGVSPLDPLAHGAALLVLAAFALAASLLPALRAARSDPVLALRHE